MDLLIVIVIGISALQTMWHAPTYIMEYHQKTKDNNIIIKEFYQRPAFGMELESANAILKMGISC